MKIYRKLILVLAHANPVKSLSLGYCCLAIAGFLLLGLPFFSTRAISPMDHLFTAVSAISTTGLTSVTLSDHYTFAGQLLILILIQIGGLGYMSFGSFIILTGQKRLPKLSERLIRSDFGLPDNFHVPAFIQSVVVFSVVVEVLGSICLFFIFRGHHVPQPLWQAIFHSVSAFCTAGFSLFPDNLIPFASDPWFNGVISALSLLGAIGFIVVLDIWEKCNGRKKQVTFTTKIILVFTVAVTLIGWGVLYLTEPHFLQMRGWASLFQSMSAFTTVGFNTVPIESLSHGALYFMTILMLMGASPAGTGGGIKSTTLVAVFSQMMSTFRGQADVTFLGHKIPDYRLRLASASFNFYIILLVFGIYLLNLTDQHRGMFEIIFEATSALGTVGLSMGMTPFLSIAGKGILICLMMLGRIGPLSIGLALFYRRRPSDLARREEDVVL